MNNNKSSYICVRVYTLPSTNICGNDFYRIFNLKDYLI